MYYYYIYYKYILRNTMKITFNKKKYELKYSFRALMIYENITNKSFKPESLTDIITFFYSVLLSTARTEPIQFDDFIDYLDEHPELISEFSNWLLETIALNDTKSPASKSNAKDTKEDPNQ